MAKHVLHYAGVGCYCRSATKALDAIEEVDFFNEYPEAECYKYFCAPTVAMRETEDFTIYRLKGYLAPYAGAEATDTTLTVINLYKSFNFDTNSCVANDGRVVLLAMTTVTGGTLLRYKKETCEVAFDMVGDKILERVITEYFVDDLSKHKLRTLLKKGAIIVKNEQNIDEIKLVKDKEFKLDRNLFKMYVDAYYVNKQRDEEECDR